MAKKGKAAKKSLEAPIVSEADKAKAVKMLEDEATIKRARTSMAAWLAKSGKRDIYNAWSTESKKSFLVAYHADRMNKHDAKNTQKSTRKVSHKDSVYTGYTWMNLQQMINMWGDDKAKAKRDKFDTMPDRHQPDPDTKSDDAMNREYKVFRTEGGEHQEEENANEDESVGKIEDKEAAAALRGQLDAMTGVLTGAQWLDADTNLSDEADATIVKKEHEETTVVSGSVDLQKISNTFCSNQKIDKSTLFQKYQKNPKNKF